MAEILLTSEAFVKSAAGLRDNIAGNYILPAIREAQETRLREILGDALIDRLKDMVADRSISDVDNALYKALLDKCQYLLAYSAAAEAAANVALKVGNLGVSRASDENLEPASHDDVSALMERYRSKADAACLRLQRWLLANKEDFPELGECDCGRLEANLRSAASCGIWLGGARGRRIPR